MRPKASVHHAVARPRRRLLLGAIAAALVLAAPASAAAAPTINLNSACRNTVAPYAFNVSLSGFPPNLPFHAVVRWSDQDHIFDYVTDPDGSTPTIFESSNAPMKLVLVTVTATIGGSSRTFAKRLLNPCSPPLSLGAVMCGEDQYLVYQFPELSTCLNYVSRLEAGTAVARFTVIPVCDGKSNPSLVGFTALLLGLAPGTGVTASIAWDTGTFGIGTAADRLGAVGPAGILTGATKKLTVTLSSPDGTFSATLNTASCAQTAGARRRNRRLAHALRRHRLLWELGRRLGSPSAWGPGGVGAARLNATT